MTTDTHTRRSWLLIAGVLVFSTVSGAEVAMASSADGHGPYVDVDGSPHEPAVTALWEHEITQGCGPWRFCPDDPITRGQMAALLSRALGLASVGGGFRDAGLSPFHEEIAALGSSGIAEGCAPDRYCPGRVLTRGQLASLLARALELKPADRDWFGDDTGSVHEDAINRVAAAGITRGCTGTQFCPHRALTRAETATFLARAFKLGAPAQVPAIPQKVIDQYRAETLRERIAAGVGAERWRPLVAEYFRPEDVDRALRVMACESRGNPWAVNPISGASGLFQHLPRFWEGRAERAGWAGASIFDPEANIAVSAHLLYKEGGWSHWVCKG